FDERDRKKNGLKVSSVPSPRFASTSRHASTRTSQSKGHWRTYYSSAALNPKFATGLAAISCELRVRGTSCLRHVRCPFAPRRLRQVSLEGGFPQANTIAGGKRTAARVRRSGASAEPSRRQSGISPEWPRSA